MPSILSKILMPHWSVPYNCYEIGHTWTPSCSEAAIELGIIVFKESLKLYTPLYLLSQGLQKGLDVNGLKQSINSIIRSSLFLSFNGFSVILLFCLTRQLMGKFYYSLCAYTPAFIGSLLAITIERPSRRPALALYVANIASETIFRIFISRGYMKPIKNGEILLFTVTMSILLYIIKKNGFGVDPVSLALKFIIGREESKRSNNKQNLSIDSNHMIQTNTFQLSQPVNTIYGKIVAKFYTLFPKHNSCPHKQNSCFSYICYSFLRSFFFGWFGKSAFKTLSKPRAFLLRPNFIIRNNFFSSDNLKFGLFLASFTAIYKGVNCSLRWASNGCHDWHAIIAALFAGPTMFLSPNTSITLYLMWKCIESLYCIGVKKGYIKYVMPTVHIIYAISTAQLFYSAVLEPKHMKPSYMKFLDRVTGNRLHQLNRMVLDVFGTDASAGYETYIPDFDLKYTTKRFQESVLLWLL
ncbi:transmembrane protein 135-like [Oppia nitens]|uniref:transmembrane protein 135-like n=1 Tax=Oppia nitens TaxID=1686743 RepID=UPI0023DC28A8|nr:transmembrane protein 135-like [Oppia nitens]